MKIFQFYPDRKNIIVCIMCLLTLLLSLPVFSQNPVADFTADQRTGCQGLVVTFTDNSKYAEKWTWSFPGGSPSSADTQGPHQITYNNPGAFDVILEIDGQYGSDKETKSGYIKISDCSPSADFSVTPASGCKPLTVTYTDKSTDATTWVWSFPGGLPSSTQTQGPHSVTYNSAGSYAATLEVYNQYGQDTKVRNNAVTVYSCYDYGDAPSPYPTTNKQDGARHIVDNTFYLGQKIDKESNGQPNSTATGDDTHGSDDEDGVQWLQGLIPNNRTLIRVTASAEGYLKAWIDWNQDGDWDDSGEVVCNSQLHKGVNDLYITVPSDAKEGYSFARFRFAEDDITSFKGLINRGEVEDYRIQIIKDVEFDYGDAPYPYKTRYKHNGARHIIDPAVYLGNGVDGDPDGIPDSLAMRDDNYDKNDDEDGVIFKGVWVPGDSAWMHILPSTNGYVSIWIDLDQDGLWDNEDEKVSGFVTGGLDLQKTDGHVSMLDADGCLAILLPENAKTGFTYARCRFSTLPIDSSDGIAVDGEVEDYRIEINDPLDLPAEYGDAPEGIMAYPDKGVTGRFPTLEGTGPADYIKHGTLGKMYFGYSVDYEMDGDAGDAAPVGDPWDTDEGLNDRRGDVTIYRDIGLTDPCNYTILGEAGSEYYWPYSVLSVRGVLGDAGETVQWGDYNLDGVYHVTAQKGAYFNVLIDWNQDGSWGGNYSWHDGSSAQTTPEHIIQNFFIPKGEGLNGYGRLSDLDPPEFVLPDDISGYVWMRWTLSDELVDAGWDGSGKFSDGETEDYLVAVNYDSLFDYGDAPQGALAYPSTGVIGDFQTAWGIPGTIGGAIWHHTGTPKYFGNCVDYEWTGNAGLAYSTPWVYDADEDYNNEVILDILQDAGLRQVMPYKIQGSPGLETVEPYIPFASTSLRRSLGGVGETAVWGTNIDMELSLRTGEGYTESYFSLIIDWDQDGLWETSEWVHKNILLTHTGSSFDGMLSELSIPDFEIGANTGYVWARFILSERPVNGWYGEFFAGETEDYLLHISERSFRYDWGDAPSPFPTSSQENGARHVFNQQIYMGSSIDTEEEGQGDAKAGTDHDDGVAFEGAWIPGDTVTAYITISDTGYLSIWSNFGPDGSIIKLQEDIILDKCQNQFFKNVSESPDAEKQYSLQKQLSNKVLIPVPENASTGVAYLRFRFSTQPIDSLCGPADDGEVEDYRIEIFDDLELPYEYGDAPETVIAYPHLLTIGNFPTFESVGSNGFVKHARQGQMKLGAELDYELEGNAGVTPPIGGNYDQDEKHNDLRSDTRVTSDIGLVAPYAYSIIEQSGKLVYWPYSVFTASKSTLGWAGEYVTWGSSTCGYLDVSYVMNDPEGGYINMLIDWNQDGQWSGTEEHVLVNFFVPPGSGDLSSLGPPSFIIPDTPGHAWMRLTISDSDVPEPWDGTGEFTDGETEDYLICITYRDLYDFGDAPEGALAYPSTGVTGNFPTCVNVTNSGFIRHAQDLVISFGFLDYEYEGNAGLSPIFTEYYNADEGCVNLESYPRDAGLRSVFPHTIVGPKGSETVVPYDDGSGLPFSIGSVGQMAAWGTNLDLCLIIDSRKPGAYVNVLIDWNQDGHWGDFVKMPDHRTTVSERVVRNHYVGSSSTHFSHFSPPDFRIGPNPGYVWMRCTITGKPIETRNWDGSGDFVDGETEDYLLKIEDYSGVFDFGDAPVPAYGVLHADNGAIHTVESGFCLGEIVDPDPDGRIIPGGYGDDNDGSDDDDGIEFLTPLIPGQTAQIKATISGSGFLSGWIDFNADSSWNGPDEQIWEDSQVTSGTHTISFTVPSDAAHGVTYARFRFSDTGGFSYNGPPHFSDYPDQSSMPPTGEVEDYAVLIHAAGAAFDYGDAPDPGYPTLSGSGGAYHVIDNNVYMGSKIDSEGNGLAHVQALGDDNNGSDDEDGIQFPSTIVSGSTVTASVTLSVKGYLNIWIDLNADGDWFDLYEHVVNDSLLIAGTHTVNFPATLTAIPDSLMFARVRFSTFPGVGVMGPAADGEVEDYLLNVLDTDVDDKNKPDFIPENFELQQNYPNPFNPSTSFLYKLPRTVNVIFTIYNINGSVVREYDLGQIPAGVHMLKWDGCDGNGKHMATGIYVYRIQAAMETGKHSFQAIKKMILLK